MYQMMDQGFVGLIFSVFNEDKNLKQSRLQVTCFQSVERGSEYCRVEVPLCIVPSRKLGAACVQSLVELPSILSMEEEEAYEKATRNKDLDLVTKIHNASVFTKSLCHVIDVLNGPVLQTLEGRLQRNMNRILELKKEKEELLKMLKTI